MNIIKAIIAFVSSGLGILFLVLGLGIDLTYSGRIDCSFLQRVINALKEILIPIGCSYHKAGEIISGSMGISFTTLSLLLSMGINLSNRFEIKIFGIPRWELGVSAAHKMYNWFRVLIYVFPFVMLICVNLEFYVLGHLVLAYSMIFLIVEYMLIIRSYKWNKNIDFTVTKLIKVFENKNNKNISNYSEYQVWLEEIRLGIEKSDGWEKAEQLYEHFVQRVSEFRDEKCYISSYFFFDIIFCKGKQPELNDSALRCIKSYICQLYDRNNKKWNEVVFCSLMKVAFRYWDEAQIYDFLKWFLDYTNRSEGGDINKIRFIEAEQVIQINILLVMIEEWKSHQKKYNGLLNSILNVMWFQGELSIECGDKYLRLFEIIHDTEKQLRYKDDNTLKAYENLQKDFEKNHGISFIGNTIRKEMRFNE
ncbi:MAG: hypothetical protein PUC12_14705 [Clostridiales bacterium]|nr:hypothetical protein [Clostridiales bacterium]